MYTNRFECEVALPGKTPKTYIVPVFAGCIGLFIFYNLYSNLTLDDLLAIYKFALSAVVSLVAILYSYISLKNIFSTKDLNISKSTYLMNSEHVHYTVGLVTTIIEFKDIKRVDKPEVNSTHLSVTLRDNQKVAFPLPENRNEFYECINSQIDNTL